MSKLVLFVLDMETGRPARDIGASLFCLFGDHHELIHEGLTGPDGCLRTSVPAMDKKRGRPHRIIIQAAAHFGLRNKKPTFPEICIDFLWDRKEKLVLPVLITAHSYTVYRGS